MGDSGAPRRRNGCGLAQVEKTLEENGGEGDRLPESSGGSPPFLHTGSPLGPQSLAQGLAHRGTQ